MVAIHNISFSRMKREQGSARVRLGAALAMAAFAAGASLAEGTGVSDLSLQAQLASPATLAPTAATVGAAEPAAAQPAAAEDAGSRRGAEEQRRIFMLLLLNSAGPLRSYNGLSR